MWLSESEDEVRVAYDVHVSNEESDSLQSIGKRLNHSTSLVMVLMSKGMRLRSSIRLQSSSMVLRICIRERFQSRRELFQESELELVL